MTDQEIEDLNIEDNNNDERGAESVKSFIFEIVKVLIISLIIIIPIRAYVVQPFYVDGDSMEPNFSDGQYLVVDEISYRFKEPQRGDIVIFHPPNNPKVYYIKRMIGLPGEVVDIKDGVIRVFAKDSTEALIIDEQKYLSADFQLRPSENDHVVLADDEYYLLGDNRQSSLDSRRLGPINANLIKGRVVLRAFPFDEFTLIKTPQY
ncbi:MAG: signal peptidase I [Candidatus Komeilibacteria bacterium]